MDFLDDLFWTESDRPTTPEPKPTLPLFNETLAALFAPGHAKSEARKFLVNLLSSPVWQPDPTLSDRSGPLPSFPYPLPIGKPPRTVSSVHLLPGPTGLTGEACLALVPGPAEGVAFRFNAETTHVFSRAAFPALLRLAASARLVASLATPGPHLLDGTWYAPRGNRKLKPVVNAYDIAIAQIFTHPDRIYDHLQPAEEIPGRELWHNLANRQDYDAVAINPNSGGPTWGPHVPALVVAGQWPGPLPLRSEAELTMYLDFSSFPSQGRKIITAPVDSTTTLVRAHIPPDRWSPVFTQLPSAAGPSQILCAGALAYPLSFFERSVPSRWQWKKDSHRRDATKRATYAAELLALIPPGESKVPRAALRTPDGAKFLRLNPQYAQRPWIEQQLAAWRAVAESRFPIGF